MNINKLSKARRKIDSIDAKIFNLIKKRTKIVKYMLSIKEFKKQIIDHKRINEILKKIKSKSIKNKSNKNNIDPKITKRIWINMIYAFIDFEKRNFKKK